MDKKNETIKDKDKLWQKEDSIREDQIDNSIHIGPGDDCNCPICIFNRSQAPGQPYDLSQCPKYNSTKKNKSKKIKE